jgi:replicative DNA helicase
MNIKQAEQLLIGAVLRYGKPAATLVIPAITPTKFIFGEEGFSEDHARIWSALSREFLQTKATPTISAIGYKQDYLQALVTNLEKEHGVYAFDPNLILSVAELVFKAGTIYRISKSAADIATVTKSEAVFQTQVESIASLNEWLADIIEKFQIETSEKTGYRPVSELVPTVLEEWERQFAGEQLILLPCGIPSFLSAQLFPRGQLAVLHGMTGTGKSALLLTILLGTAIGLKVNAVQGCVAVNSMEMSYKDLIARGASFLAGIDYTRLIGGKTPLSEQEFEKLTDWAEFVSELPLFIDDSNLVTTDVLRYQAFSLNAGEHGPLLQLGTDYSELFTDDIENKEQRIEKVARNHFAIARMLDASVIMISQSTYSSTNKYHIAGLNGLRWSRGASMAANVIIELVNYPAMSANGLDFKTPEEMDEYHAWLQIQKYRGGQTGQFPLKWEGTYTRFFDPALFTKENDSVVYDHLMEIPQAKRLLDKWRYAL